MTVHPQPRRGPGVALGAVSVVLLAATVLLVVLYMNKRADTREVKDRLATVERSVTGATEQLTENESTVDTLEVRHQELSETNATLHACADPAKAALVAAKAGDQAGVDTALDKMFANCGE